jgi:methionyl-tRNA synthetase
MSKSIGNVVDPQELAAKYGSEGVRYFLLREIPTTGDGDFTYEKFEKRYNSDLASGLGNLFSRTLAMVIKAGLDKEFEIKPNSLFVEKNIEIENKVAEKFIQFNETLMDIWELVSFCDKYIEEEKPWEVTDVAKQKEIFSNLIYSLNSISKMIEPFLPSTSQKMKEQLGEKNNIFNVTKGESLFPRI